MNSAQYFSFGTLWYQLYLRTLVQKGNDAIYHLLRMSFRFCTCRYEVAVGVSSEDLFIHSTFFPKK